MSKRDLSVDLAICNDATAGPLYVVDAPSGIYATEIDGDVFAECERIEDARFIAEARTGWPHAIERALQAERKLAEIDAVWNEDSSDYHLAMRIREIIDAKEATAHE